MTREEAITILETLWNNPLFNDSHKEALNIAIEALEHPKKNVISIVPCGDAISRQAVLDGLASIAKAKAKSDAQKSLMGRVMFFTEQLPSVTPQQRTGRWIDAEVLDNIRAEIETDLSHFCFDEWGNENPTWKEIKAIIDKYKAESEEKE